MGTDPIILGLPPTEDGWGTLYRSYGRIARVMPVVRKLVRLYFLPTEVERWGRGKVYRIFGIHLFGRIIPTGGLLIRRLTGARMAPYTLRGPSLESARQFFFRTCAFEAAHLPFFLALLALTVIRIDEGRLDLAIENSIVNIFVNLLPMMHHRHTRVRILELIILSGKK